MDLEFLKYQASGNDFIMIDGRNDIKLNPEQIKFLCDRHFGIGSDGILIIRNSKKFDFRMEFYNPDGTQATFCGNGGRCIVKFAQELKIINSECKFEAADGRHSAQIIKNKVKLQMIDVTDIKIFDDLIYLNTGTHHAVKFVNELNDELIENAPNIRYDKRFQPFGTNVNFVEQAGSKLKVRTYEKGVEAETLSCGTGVVASALAYALNKKLNSGQITVKARGGELKVEFQKSLKGFENVYLIGEAKKVFKGSISF